MATLRGGGVHTVANPDGDGWINEIRGIKIVDPPFRLKSDATATGRILAIQLGTDHTIHRKNGRTAKRNSYGNDQYPPADS